jgi:hypothetical protein
MVGLPQQCLKNYNDIYFILFGLNGGVAPGESVTARKQWQISIEDQNVGFEQLIRRVGRIATVRCGILLI